MARVLKGSHTFTCTPRVHPLTEWTISAFSFPAEADLHLPTRRDGRLSWPARCRCCHKAAPSPTLDLQLDLYHLDILSDWGRSTDLWRWAVQGLKDVLLRAASTAYRSSGRRRLATPTGRQALLARWLWVATAATRSPSATRRPAVGRSSSSARRWPAGWRRPGSRVAPAFRARGTGVPADWAPEADLQQRQRAAGRRRPRRRAAAVNDKHCVASPLSVTAAYRRDVARD